MPYTVFALKWRPKNFDEIVGQPHVVSTLKSAIETGRLAHAYLFSGPRGVGKTSTARILAKSLNCKNGPTVNPCQQCASCKEIGDGRSLDVIEIDGASNRGIDEVRVLRENVKFAPVSGKYKIYIIDEVHMLTTEAFNALLKTLEEPPEFVKFIFATTQPHKILTTIVSRCQRFDFRRIPALQIAEQLQKISTAEKIPVHQDVLFAVAKSSDGSLRDAESIFDQLISFSQQKISLADVVSVLGVVEQEVLFDIADAVIRKDPQAALTLLSKVIDDGKDTGIFLNNLIEHFRNLMIAKITHADANLIDLPEEVCQRLLKQSEKLSLEEIFSAFNVLVATQEIAKRLDSMRIPLEICLVRLAHSKKGPAINTEHSPSAASSPTRANKPHAAPVSAPVVSAAPQPAIKKVSPNAPVPKDPDPLDPPQSAIALEVIQSRWQEISGRLAGVKMSVSTYLLEGEPVGVRGSVLTVSFPKSCSLHKESLEVKENRALIENILAEIFGVALRINFVLSEEQQKRKDDAEGSTFLKSALDMFGGRVIKEE